MPVRIELLGFGIELVSRHLTREGVVGDDDLVVALRHRVLVDLEALAQVDAENRSADELLLGIRVEAVADHHDRFVLVALIELQRETLQTSLWIDMNLE